MSDPSIFIPRRQSRKIRSKDVSSFILTVLFHMSRDQLELRARYTTIERDENDQIPGAALLYARRDGVSNYTDSNATRRRSATAAGRATTYSLAATGISVRIHRQS